MCSMVIRLGSEVDLYSGGGHSWAHRDGAPLWTIWKDCRARRSVQWKSAYESLNRQSRFPKGLFVARFVRRSSSFPSGHGTSRTRRRDRCTPKRIYPGTREGFATNILEANRLGAGRYFDGEEHAGTHSSYASTPAARHSA